MLRPEKQRPAGSEGFLPAVCCGVRPVRMPKKKRMSPKESSVSWWRIRDFILYSLFFMLAEYQYFTLLFLPGLRKFCPDYVPGKGALIFRYYLKKSSKIYYLTSAHPAGSTFGTMPLFSNNRSMVRCCSAMVSCCEHTVSISIEILSKTSLGKLILSCFRSPVIFIPSLMSISCKVFASKTGRFSHCPIVWRVIPSNSAAFSCVSPFSFIAFLN